MNKNICPICGYDRLDEPPYDEYGDPSYEICNCCGCEFGFHDTNNPNFFHIYREDWIRSGFIFKNQEKKPNIWNEKTMRKQLENIKKVDYKPYGFS